VLPSLHMATTHVGDGEPREARRAVAAALSQRAATARGSGTCERYGQGRGRSARPALPDCLNFCISEWLVFTVTGSRFFFLGKLFCHNGLFFESVNLFMHIHFR
jgi:hypothetical protein